MRLLEVDSSDSNLVLLLRNLVAQADSQNQPSFLSWEAVNNLMQNIGDEQFDYDSFKTSYDTNPQVQSLVQRFDAKGIELKTKTKNPKKPEGEGGDNIAKMAKSATARRMNESEIEEIAALFEALALRDMLLTEGRLDEAGIWSGIKSAVGKGVAGVKSANDAINRLGQLAQNTAPVQNFDSRVDSLIKTIADKNPQVADKVKQYGEWAKKNPIKQGLIIGMVTAIASLVGGPAGGAAAGAVLRAGNELLKGEKASTAVGKAVKGAAFGWIAGLGVRALGDFIANTHLSMHPLKGIRGVMDANLDFKRVEMGTRTSGSAIGHLRTVIPVDMSGKLQGWWDAAVATARQGKYVEAQRAFDSIQNYFDSPDYKKFIDNIAATNDALRSEHSKFVDGANQIKDIASKLSAAVQGAATGASAAAKPAGQKAAPQSAAQPASNISPDKRAELEKKRADMLKRLKQQGKM